MLREFLDRVREALRRARFGIATVALTYAISVLAGGALVHGGNRFALGYRDRLVGRAWKESVIMRNLQQGNRLHAAALDAAGNAFGGAASLLAGYFPPAGYLVTMSRGWIGGVVAVDNDHRSRLSTPREAFYYLTTLILQLIPYSLAGGAGVNLGLASFSKRGRAVYQGRRVQWLLVPYQALGDAGWIYLISLPLFAAASLFEFMAV
jgi:hypothetical protein